MRRRFTERKQRLAQQTTDRIARFADHRASCEDCILYGTLQEGLPRPSSTGYLVYVIEEARVVFTQVVWLSGADRPREAHAEPVADTLSRQAFRTARKRLEGGTYEPGGVYLEQLHDGGLMPPHPGGPLEA